MYDSETPYIHKRPSYDEYKSSHSAGERYLEGFYSIDDLKRTIELWEKESSEEENNV